MGRFPVCWAASCAIGAAAVRHAQSTAARTEDGERDRETNEGITEPPGRKRMSWIIRFSCLRGGRGYRWNCRSEVRGQSER